VNPLSLQEVRQAVSGKALSAFRGDEQVRSVNTDSRQSKPGSVFVALKGDRFDGHDHLPGAAAGGSVAAIVDREPSVDLPNMKFIQVPDTRVALGRLATHVRSLMPKCRVIAVAGSNGKTSTKHLVQAALSCRLTGSISPKSYNNDIGVPLTIFEADPNQDYLVLEIGTNHRGEIRTLTNIARPDIAVITNCGAEHLEGLGDLRGVRQENASIIEGLNPNGLLVINGDDADLKQAVRQYPGRIVTFGFDPTNDVWADDVQIQDNGTSFRLNGRSTRVFVPMIGRHNALNALAAIAVAKRFVLPEDEMILSLGQSSRPEMRMQRTDTPFLTLLNDAYNANPSSMTAGLTTLIDLETDGRRVAIVGDMKELGEHSERYHREIGRLVAEHRKSIDLLITVGKEAKFIATEAVAAKFPKARVKSYEDAARALPLTKLIRERDLILIKGSRSMRLETLVDPLTTLTVAGDAVEAVV
jgi:UDP-N-acetylmuramoyl-tripeptide--D-alanyl-D-alanine ligase